MKSEISFKVGDWCIDARDNSIKQVINPKSPVVSAYYELWQPKEGEWCWFRSKVMPKHIQVLAQFKDFSKDDTMVGLYTVIFDKNDVEEGTLSIHYDECEPFIGELPTFVKNKGNTHD